MDLIKKNTEECNPRPGICTLHRAQLDWNKFEQFSEIEVIEAGTETKRTFAETKIDYVVGSDVIYWPSQIDPLTNLLKKLFEIYPELVIYICYIERHASTHRELLEKWKIFQVESVEQEIC